VLGVVAQLERALIAERTKAGLHAGDPKAIRKIRARRDAAQGDGVLARLHAWLPTVRQMRPAQPWGDVVRVLNRTDHGAPRQPGDDRSVRLVAGIAAAAADRTLQQIVAQLETMRERTPRGGTRWHPSSVKHLLVRAERLGLTRSASAHVGPGVWRQP
jgi:hypothetical protein